MAKYYKDFKEAIRQHEIETKTKYVYNYGRRSFTDNEVPLSSNIRLHWDDTVPYFHIGTRSYICHLGKDINIYQKNKYAQECEEKAFNDHIFTKKMKLINATKKLECPATFIVTRVYRMQNYEIPIISEYHKLKTAKTIKQKLKENERLGGKEMFRIKFPDISEHQHHVIGASAAVDEPIDERIREKISEYVQQGERNVNVIMKSLSMYATEKLLQTDRMRQKFFPDKASVSKIVSHMKRNLRKSEINMKNNENTVTN